MKHFNLLDSVEQPRSTWSLDFGLDFRSFFSVSSIQLWKKKIADSWLEGCGMSSGDEQTRRKRWAETRDDFRTSKMVIEIELSID